MRERERRHEGDMVDKFEPGLRKIKTPNGLT